MILERAGKICDGLYSIGHHSFPAFLIMSDPPALFDSGLTISGPRYLKDLKEYLGNVNRIGYIFLTHSHYDHCGAIPFLKRNIKGVKIAASGLAANIFRKPKAIRLIQSLSKDYEEQLGNQIRDENIFFDSIDVDVTLKDGDKFNLGDDWNIHVIATPGHTRDSVSYYIPKLKALIPGEATGVYNSNFDIQSEFSSSYNDYVNSLEKLATLDIDILLLPHAHILTGGDAQGHIQKTLESAKVFKKRIDVFLNQFNGDQEDTVKAIFKEDYEDTQAVRQDERSFLINLAAKVKAVAERK
jgi:glyoxylase-like metal-dependent hydrolase (beta-lactamase superfamily II)